LKNRKSRPALGTTPPGLSH